MTATAPTDFLSFDDVRTKLLSLSDVLSESVRRVVNKNNEQFNSDLDDFKLNLVAIIKCGTIGEALEILFNSYDLVGNTARDQYILSIQLFDFGDDDTIIEASPKQALNKKTINTGVQVDSLALAFANSVRIEYSNQEDLQIVIDQLDAQYEKVLNQELPLDSDTRVSLLNLKTVSFSFFSQLDLKSIIEIETTTIPSTVLAYKYYKDSTRSDEIVSLNDVQNTGFIEGTVKILSS